MAIIHPLPTTGKCQGITITPFAAGHTLGGTIWKIRSPSAGTLVYAVDMNHMRERHLDGTVLLRTGPASNAVPGVFEPLARPDLFITDADRALIIGSRRKDRDKALLGPPLPCIQTIRINILSSLFPLAFLQTSSQTPCVPLTPFSCPPTLAPDC